MRFSPGEEVEIPSPIDVHVHLREPGGTHKETMQSGTRAALYGGYQAVFDMPNNPDSPTLDLDRVDQKYGIAQETSQTNIGFYGGVDLENPDFGSLRAMQGLVAGLKLYMGHTTGNVKEHNLEIARPTIDDWIINSDKIGVHPPILLHAREEVGYVTAQYITDQGYPVHWCHLSTASEARYSARLTRSQPEHFTSGVTPHHLTMTSIDSDYKYGWRGARMMPPLGKEEDHEALIDFFNEGHIQILETDHAPHTEKEKQTAELENPVGHDGTDCTTCFGVSGIEFVLPIMMSLVQRNKITMERLVDSLHTQPIKMLGLKKDGNRATTTLKIGPYTIGEEHRAGKSKNNPYVGWTGWAKVMDVEIDGVSRYRHQAYPPDFTPRILKTGSEV